MTSSKFGASFVMILLVLLCHLGVQADNPRTDAPLSSYEIVMSWPQLDFKFTSTEERQEMINSSEFIPKNNIITGIKIKRKRIFLVVPRWREGIPSTLVYVNYDSNSTISSNPIQQETNSALLIPYPSWEAQQVGNCSAFQYVQSIETDPFNRLWIIDTGFQFATPTVPKCPPKLVIMNLVDDKILLSYTFPPEVVSPKRNLLSELVVACPDISTSDDCWAYVTDSLGEKLIIFNLRNNQSWAVRHSSMKANSSADDITILGNTYSFHTNINGLALSPLDKGFDTLYYCSFSSYNVYSVPTKILKMAGSSGYFHQLMDSDVSLIGYKFSQSDGLAMASNGLLFYGILSSNAVSYWNTSDRILSPNSEVLLVQNDIDLQWPGAFCFDEAGYIYATTNRLQRSLTNSYDINDINFRIVRMYIGTKSYQHSASEILTTDNSVVLETDGNGNIKSGNNSNSSQSATLFNTYSVSKIIIVSLVCTQLYY